MQILNKKGIDFTPLLIISNSILLFFLLLTSLINSGRLGKLANADTPTLVELSDGNSVRVTPIGSKERTPQAITNFVGRTMTGLLNWNALPKIDEELYPNKKPELDSGVQTGDKKITTNTWAAGFALSEDFRVPFLRELSNLTPDSVFNGSTQSALIVRYLSPPKKIKEGEWEVSMVSNLIIFQNGNQVGKAISFNKSIFVRAIDNIPLPKNASILQQAPYQARKAGLEIFKIQDLNL